MDSNNTDITDQLAAFKNKYKEQKSSLFSLKSTRNMERAKEITSNISIEKLLSKTIFNVENTNKIYMDYPNFKLFTTPEIYDVMLEYVDKLLHNCVNTYGSVELHANLNTFTITAANRYKDLIQRFCKQFFQSDSKYNNEITKIYLHNYPKIIPILNSLFSGFVDDKSYDKLVLV